MRKRYAAFIILGIAAALLVGCAYLTLNSFHNLSAINRRAADSYEALFHLQRAISALKDVRGGARAVMLTGDAANGPDLQPAVRGVYAELAQVQKHLAGDPEMAHLDQMIDRFVIRAQGIAASGKIPTEHLAATVAEEKKLVAEIGQHVGFIEGREIREVAGEEALLESDAMKALVAGGVAGLAMLVLMSITLLTLRNQMRERIKTQRTMAATNEELTFRMAELQHRSKEIQLLSEMSEVLQVSGDLEETGKVLPMFMSRLFPGFTAAVYVLKSSRNLLESVACWGDEPVSATFAPSDCWAMRKGRMHLVLDSSSLLCNHVNLCSEAAQICVPMVAQGDAIGVLYLRAPAVGTIDAEMQAFAKTVADQISLALANLRLQETLRTRAVRDPLTNLFNRRYLEESLEREIHRAKRNGTILGVMMLDLDHFKRFNDTFGHAGGDALLQQFAHMVQTLFREEDIVCRYGGEEFAVMLPDTTEEAARTRAEELRANVKNLHARLNGQSLGTVTVSVGIAVTSAVNSTAQGIFAAADHALYEAKRSGRDRVVSASARAELRVVAAEA